MFTEINYNFDVDARGKISKIRCPPRRYSIDIWLSPQEEVEKEVEEEVEVKEVEVKPVEEEVKKEVEEEVRLVEEVEGGVCAGTTEGT